MQDEGAPDSLHSRLEAGDRAAVAEALNLADDQREEQRRAALALLDHLERTSREKPRPVRRVGITGAPGAGKSTLLDALVQHLRERGETVGIIAVDPSSPRTGGALLGDRVRVRASSRDPGVFLRSMAARDRLGGLADATFAGVAILSAAFDWVFVETVGVGQSEGDVADLVDTLLFVAQPGAGDILQFMKAGIMELPDVFCVNKADLGTPAERAVGELEAGLGLGEAHASGWRPPVLLVAALKGSGVEEVLDAVAAHRRHLEESGELAPRRERGRIAYLCESLERRYGSHGVDCLGGREAIAARGRSEDASVFALVRTLSQEIEAALRG